MKRSVNQFSLLRLIVITLISGVLFGATMRTPVDYVVPESIMRQRIVAQGVAPPVHYHNVGVPFGGIRIQEVWDVGTLSRKETTVGISFAVLAGDALFWFTVVTFAFVVASRLTLPKRNTQSQPHE